MQNKQMMTKDQKTINGKISLQHKTRLSRKIITDEKRQAFLDSTSGVRTAKLEIINLFIEIEQIISTSNKKEIPFKIKIATRQNECLLYCRRFTLQILWISKYKNTLKESVLSMRLWKGTKPINGSSFFHIMKPKLIKEWFFAFNLNERGEKEWNEASADQRFFSTKQLAQIAISRLIKR